MGLEATPVANKRPQVKRESLMKGLSRFERGVSVPHLTSVWHLPYPCRVPQSVIRKDRPVPVGHSSITPGESPRTSGISTLKTLLLDSLSHCGLLCTHPAERFKITALCRSPSIFTCLVRQIHRAQRNELNAQQICGHPHKLS